MRRYTVYLFDFDGTTFDTRESLYYVYKDAFAAIGVNDITQEETDEFMHLSLRQSIEKRNVPASLLYPFVEAITEVINRPKNIALNEPFPETAEVLTALHDRGAIIGFVSGNSVKHIELVFEAKNFPKVSSIIMGSDVYKKGKPHPEPILMTLERLGIEPSQDVVYVGDSLQDVECSLAAGISAVFIDRDHLYGQVPGATMIASLKDLLAE